MNRLLSRRRLYRKALYGDRHPVKDGSSLGFTRAMYGGNPVLREVSERMIADEAIRRIFPVHGPEDIKCELGIR